VLFLFIVVLAEALPHTPEDERTSENKMKQFLLRRK
jgi:hypothetical protein